MFDGTKIAVSVDTKIIGMTFHFDRYPEERGADSVHLLRAYVLRLTLSQFCGRVRKSLY